MRASGRNLCWFFAAASLAAVAACDSKGKEEAMKLLNESNDKLVQCRKDTNDLRNEISGLKRQLAQAMANPGRVTLTDPEVLNLIASIKGAPAAAPGGPKNQLDPAAASKVVFQGSQALRQCYERALKRNPDLQYQAGIGVTLAVTVRPQGSVDDVEVKPSVDGEMTTCIRTAAMRWKFPAFAGDAVTIEQKLTLTPSKT
jgi:hypothetical protein